MGDEMGQPAAHETQESRLSPQQASCSAQTHPVLCERFERGQAATIRKDTKERQYNRTRRQFTEERAPYARAHPLPHPPLLRSSTTPLAA
eukprot:895731-Rhodomonas_salina.1